MADLTAVIEANDRNLRVLAFRLLGDRDAMDDVLQEAYAKAFRGIARFRGDSSASTWLYRIVYNACLDELRRRRPAEQLPRDAQAPSENLDLRIDLAHALGTLAPEERGCRSARRCRRLRLRDRGADPRHSRRHACVSSQPRSCRIARNACSGRSSSCPIVTSCSAAPSMR
jgi:RNA polymerase sigma factor (sigma-70 family)